MNVEQNPARLLYNGFVHLWYNYVLVLNGKKKFARFGGSLRKSPLLRDTRIRYNVEVVQMFIIVWKHERSAMLIQYFCIPVNNVKSCRLNIRVSINFMLLSRAKIMGTEWKIVWWIKNECKLHESQNNIQVKK